VPGTVKLEATIHIHLHDGQDRVLHRLDQIVDLINNLGVRTMASTAELLALAKLAAEVISKFGPAVDALEAAVTAALAKLPMIPAEAQAEIDETFATIRGIVDTGNAALADAADGVDEAKP
jgi:hypothetical protein